MKSKHYDSDDEKKSKKFFKKKESSSSRSSLKSLKNPSKSFSNQKYTSRKAKAYIGKEMDSDEEESSDSKEAEDSKEDSDSGMAGIACAARPASKASSDDETPAFCFMAKSSKEKESSRNYSIHSSDQFSSDEDDRVKLIKIAKKQQNSLEKLEKTLRKSEGLLVEEMEKNQSLTEEYSTLEARLNELMDRHEFLSADHERLTYEPLKRKQELMSLREAHDDLIKENSLLTR
jgi:hypothetical protein